MDIQKREGYTQPYNWSKVVDAVSKALEESDELSKGLWVNNIPDVAHTVEQLVFRKIEDYDDIITVEDIQDLIEDELMTLGFKDTARVYIKYREARAMEREKGWMMDDLQYAIWNKKYRQQNEDLDRWVDRVSGGNPKVGKLIKQKKFIFAGRILAHRGLVDKKITYSNCYVIPSPEDNIESIFDTAKYLARTYSAGGGCGVDISNLRPKGARVNNSAKETSGATSFMQLFDLTTALIGQNGRRK